MVCHKTWNTTSLLSLTFGTLDMIIFFQNYTTCQTKKNIGTFASSHTWLQDKTKNNWYKENNKKKTKRERIKK
jgi:hypothetical protein